MSKRTSSAASKLNIAALMTALVGACIAFQLNASMLSPVLVTMGRELHADDAAIGLSQTAFFTSAALFSIFLPRLSDTLGRKRVLFWMLVTMTAGTVVAALAPNLAVLYLARIIQGVSGPVVPLCLLMLRAEISEPKLYGTMLGVVTATNGGIAGIDALAGGFLAGSYGFRSVFWAIAIVATLATISVWIWARESRPSKGVRMDWIGVATLSVAVGAFLIALDEAAKLAVANWVFVGVLVLVAVAAFVTFWRVETVRKNPLISITDLTKRSTWALLLTTLLTMTGVFATVNGVVIDYAQNAHSGFGLASGVASLALLTPYALVGWLVGPLAGRYSPILGYGRVLRIGLVGSLIAIVGMMFVGLHSLPAMIAATVLIGVTYAGTTNIVLNGLGIVLSPHDNPGILPGLNAGVFNLGAALSFVVLPAVQLIGSPAGSSSSSGYFSAILVGLIITGAALAASFLIPRPVAAEAKDETR